MKNPTATISVAKSQIKVYDGKNLFLNNGQEFEIELFNPTTKRIGAQILLNGIDISSNNEKIVLNPGQRVWIERYLSTPKKFKFETYTVEKGNSDVEAAIAQNGLVEIKFYEEHIDVKPVITWNNYTYDNYYLNNNSGTAGYRNFGSTFSTIDNAPEEKERGIISMPSKRKMCKSSAIDNAKSFRCFDECNYDASVETKNLDFVDDVLSRGILNMKPEKETGRIGQGNYSSQNFGNVNLVLEAWSFHSVKYHIYPITEKKFVTKEDICVYCTACGKKKTKDSWIFCPKCGNKF